MIRRMIRMPFRCLLALFAVILPLSPVALGQKKGVEPVKYPIVHVKKWEVSYKLTAEIALQLWHHPADVIVDAAGQPEVVWLDVNAVSEQGDPEFLQSQPQPFAILGAVQPDHEKESSIMAAMGHVVDVTGQDVGIGPGPAVPSRVRVCSPLKRRIKGVFAF